MSVVILIFANFPLVIDPVSFDNSIAYAPFIVLAFIAASGGLLTCCVVCCLFVVACCALSVVLHPSSNLLQ